MSEPNVNVVKDLISAWNSHDVQRAASHFAKDYEGVDVGRTGKIVGPDGVRSSMELYLNAFPDLMLGDLELIAQGSQVAVRWLARGTHLGSLLNIPPTGKTVVVHGASFMTMQEGRINHGVSLWDLAGLLRQFGLLPQL